MPTLLDLIGHPLETLPLQGASLVTFMRGDHRERSIFSQGLRQVESDTWVSLRFGRWHFLHDGRTQRQKLFDTFTDPAEERDVARQHPDMLKRFLRRLHMQDKLDRRLRGKIRPAVQPLDLPPGSQQQLLRAGQLGGIFE